MRYLDIIDLQGPPRNIDTIPDVCDNRDMDKTIFICQRPSFLNGMARTIDLFGSLNTYDTSDNARMADAKALRADCSTLVSCVSRVSRRC